LEENAMSKLMKSVSGIRGVVGAGLSPDLVARFAASFGTLMGGGTVVVGRDSRITGDMVYSAALSGLLASGCDVVRLGVVATPTVQLMVETLGAQGGIAVTASHNPPQWNALKFISHHGTFLQRAEAESMLAIEREDRIAWSPYDEVGSESEFLGAVDAHVERILKLPRIAADKIGARRPKVVVDALHGAGGAISSRLLEALGCDGEVLFGEPTGRFPRGAEPIPENLGILGDAVKSSGADVGFALDPDGDRLAIVDESGTPIGEELTLPLAMDFWLREQTGAVVANYSTTRWVEDVAQRYDCKLYRAPVGEANVVSKMREVDAVIGGEGNGGVILPDVHLGRDAPVAMALILSLLAEENRPISAVVGSFPRYAMVKEKFELPADWDPARLDEMESLFPDVKSDRTDGLYLRWPDGFLHVRSSGTEPIVRVIGEGDTIDVVRDRIAAVRTLVQPRI